MGVDKLRKNLALALGYLLCSVAFGQAAERQAIKSTYLPGIDFSRYHTYKWVEVKGQQHPDPNKDAEIKQLIESQLATRGLTKTDGIADLNVDYQVAITKAEKWEAYEDWSTDWTGIAGRVPTKQKVTIKVGTLVVDMYDRAAKKLVWSGTATKSVDASHNQQRTKQAVQGLLKDFPPDQPK
jgi:hypothetical protein